MLSILALLVLVALLLTVAAAMGKAPLWAAVLVLTLVELLHVWPVR
jgi:hypothetical protein